MNYKYIGSLERGERNPTLFNIGRIADALRQSPSALVSNEVIKPAPEEKVDLATLASLLRGQSAATRRKIIHIVKGALRLSTKH